MDVREVLSAHMHTHTVRTGYVWGRGVRSVGTGGSYVWGRGVRSVGTGGSYVGTLFVRASKGVDCLPP